MSLLNAYVSQDRAWMVTDTATVNLPSGATGNSSKIFPLVHANAVIGAFGITEYGLALMSICYCKTFDQIWDELVEGQLMETAAGLVEAQLRQRDLQPSPTQLVVVVGYSHAAGKCLGLRMLRDKPSGEFEVMSLAPSVACPVAPWMELPFGAGRPAGEPDTPEKLVNLARYQVRAVRENYQGNMPGTNVPMMIGGSLTLAEISQDRMTIELVAAE